MSGSAAILGVLSMKTFRIFVINPGSTSTKIAMFDNETALFKTTVNHDSTVLSRFETSDEQAAYRLETIYKVLKEEGFDLDAVDAFAGRGGSIPPTVGGTFLVTEKMLSDIDRSPIKHAAKFGPILAYELAKKYGKKAYTANHPNTDELEPVARICGFSDIERKSSCHALNQKETAMQTAHSMGKEYSECNFIVAHLGGGVSIGAHKKGRIIDTGNLINGEGPMSPTRAGSLPLIQFLDLCFSGKYTRDELYARINKNGGIMDHLGTDNIPEINERIKNGDSKAALIYDAFAYQIGKYIGQFAAVLCGKVDSIIITGGIAHDTTIVEKLKEMTEFIAPVVVYPGEKEMEALANCALRVLTGEEEITEYQGLPDTE